MLTPISRATSSGASSVLSKNYSAVSSAALRILQNMLSASKKNKWDFSQITGRNLFALRSK